MEDLSKKGLILGVIIVLILTGFTSGIDAYFINSKNTSFEKNEISFSEDQRYQYIIITNEYLKDSDFQRLIQHKSQYLNATIVTVEDIINNPDFSVYGLYGDATNTTNGNPWIINGKEVSVNFSLFDDAQSRIRNFLRFAYEKWQTKYVLLGGDVQIIPERSLRINETFWYSGTQYMWTFANIKADLYYSCLNGTWNNDFDEFFGEASNYSIDEESDFIAELYIGRAPVDNKREVKIFVDKAISFETSAKPENMLFHQAGLNQINDPDSSVIPEKCYEYIPEHYIVYKLYQTVTSIDQDKYAKHWHDPDKLIVLHIGSGSASYYYMERRLTGDISFTYDDITRLKNIFYPIHISISCNTGNFGLDHDSLAEHMLLYPNKGPSACIFNSFFGVVAEDDAHKYSGEFIERQFFEIFHNGTDRIGEFVTKSKYHFIEEAKNDLLYRWCYYTINLLGDPETPIFDIRNEIPIIDNVYVDYRYNENTQGWNITHFNKIADGINAVADSGTVHVNSGNYNENLAIHKPLSLIGQGKDNTTIIGDGNNDVIRIFDETTISGFTIKNSGNSTNASGIKIYSQMNIIRNNSIIGNNIGIKIENLFETEAVGNIFNKNNLLNNNVHIIDKNHNRFFGNYWDDYQGNDLDNDGIGDSPYPLNNGMDLCPFIAKSGWDSGNNHPPLIPIITGPKTGKPNAPYSFDFMTVDPDGDKIYFYINMADGWLERWIGPYTSYDVKNLLYYWEKAGIYNIKAKAKDEYGAETDWYTHRLIIPRNRQLQLREFPILEFIMKIMQSLRFFN